jgi:hypothetical protein
MFQVSDPSIKRAHTFNRTVDTSVISEVSMADEGIVFVSYHVPPFNVCSLSRPRWVFDLQACSCQALAQTYGCMGGEEQRAREGHGSSNAANPTMPPPRPTRTLLPLPRSAPATRRR